MPGPRGGVSERGTVVMKLADEIRGIAFLIPWHAARLYGIAREVDKMQRMLDEIVEDARQDEGLRAQVLAKNASANILPFRIVRKEKDCTF